MFFFYIINFQISEFGLLGQIIPFLYLQYLQLFIFCSCLLHAFIIFHLLRPLSHCNLLPSNLSPPLHSKHCSQGYLSCSQLWSCQVLSQSLRWFSVSLLYKVKFLLCNFEALQESALVYQWTESLPFPGSDAVLLTVCISCMTSFFYSQNCLQCLKYPLCSNLPTNLTLLFHVSLCILCKFVYECFGAKGLFLKIWDVCEVAGITMKLTKIIMKFTSSSCITL